MKKFLVLFCLSVFVASSLAQELSEELAQELPEELAQDLADDREQELQDDRGGEELDLSLDSQESEESADDRELGKRGGSALPPPVKKAPPPKKIVYRAAPKKTAPILRPAPKLIASVTYLPSAPKKAVPRKLQEVEEESEELLGAAEESDDRPEEEMPEESVGERGLGGNKKRDIPVPVKVPQPKKVAAPVYLGKKGGFYGSGYYRRLSEEVPDLSEELQESEELELEPEASSEERELGKKGSSTPIPVKVPPPVHKKIARQAPKKVIRPEPKKIVRAEPKKIIRSAPKQIVRPAPKKVIPTSSTKGNYYRRLQEAEDGSAFSELESVVDSARAERTDGESESASLLENLESENPEMAEDDDNAGDAEDGSAEDRSLGGKKRGGDTPMPLPKKVPVQKKLPAPKKIYSSKPIVYRYSKKL
ncbi:hypothetical protein TGRUB_320540 [Toxoplasma gondii RUB]|uniref:Uncharacterized protein n=4 Tax=Toxoplasma gondii TaxID=5811 RepID=A0A086LQ78_TOXGO|nr:hypothetical protein TGFOU_320540 [Toxoplasma gondii FOU]KFG58796.1 hypothetical protein TGRUB_320540 [Toxoplasma gondii RUB]KFH03854.1 hypothetical protein TGVAND_320540 [Toxoplasma gondii VAND]RQX67529.1 hypothetical protein TGCAST_320540 [Toxoplasma gondii CAST]